MNNTVEARARDLYTAPEGKAAGDIVSLSVLRLPSEEVLTIETQLIEL
ncbi:MAG: hypothetical protein K0V04_08830 [Deltaproteobacteria bacterium]|nr:hypothetical protein [Deltaproteobacteria bacterium]